MIHVLAHALTTHIAFSHLTVLYS